MDPSTSTTTTTATNSNDQNHTPTTSNDDEDHKPLIISCKITPGHQEINGESTNGEALILIGKGGPCEKLQVSSTSVVGIPPERWGQEGLLKEWMDYSTFDALLAPKETASARQALVAQAAAARHQRRGCRIDLQS